MKEEEYSSLRGRVLVTGANGFVGKVLCRALLINGHKVRAALRSSNAIMGLKHHVRGLSENANSTIEKPEWIKVGNIDSETDWSRALTDVKAVVHLAARTHVIKERALDSLAAFRKVNVAGTEQLARSAAASGVRRLIYMSSIKVNGEGTGLSPDGRDLGFSENDMPNPQDAYAQSKWEAEQVLHQVAGETGLEVVIIRPPLVYGPGVGANFFRLIRIVQRGIPIPLGSVKNARSLVYVGNLANAIVTCVCHPKASGKTFLVSDGEDVSTPELIRRIASALGRPARLVPFPVPLMQLGGRLTRKKAEVDRLLGSLAIDSSKIRRELDWKPPYSMSQGLSKTALWFKSRFQNTKAPILTN